jgi:hypothetical protein
MDTDLLSTNKNVLVALGHMLQDMIGTSTLFSGLGCVPTSPAGMTVNVNPGRAYSYQVTDAGAYSSLLADSRMLVKQGILLDAVNFSCPAPTTAGFSINYLVQGAFQEVDAGAQVLPFYNAAQPSQAYSGPNGTGASSNTYRDNTVQLSLKAGTAATTGSQVTPTPDAGFSGLWVVTVAYGASTITSGNISQYTGAPFLGASLLSQIQTAPNGVVGQASNLAMSVAAASATATLTADEIIVGTALGGQMFKLASFSKTINLATTGAGGMDAGSAPASGYVALYAIYNPTTGASALLATNATSAKAGNAYGGANMPSGYTASGLLAVWPTNASGQFIAGIQQDRKFLMPSVTSLNSTTTVSRTVLSIASAVPPNAKFCSGYIGLLSTSSTGMSINLWSTVGSGFITHPFDFNVTANVATIAPFENAQIASQSIYYSNTSGGGAITTNIFITGYTI